MVPKQGKERARKNHCDLCEQERPPIRECEFPAGGPTAKGSRSHWIDLCAECASVDRPVVDGFIVGIHAHVTAPATRHPKARKAPQGASSAENEPKPVRA